LDSIERGATFTYYGPRRGLLRRRGIAAGVVVAIDQALGIVHVRTMRPKGDGVVTDIGHIPIVWSALERSLDTIGERVPQIADDAMREVDAWRRRHGAGDVGAFSCSLWEAEGMAWEAVPAAEKELGRDRLYIAYAYPKRDSDGGYGGVEVGVHRH
jgi:hypothetical protein